VKKKGDSKQQATSKAQRLAIATTTLKLALKFDAPNTQYQHDPHSTI
jgi:hypothetical protein